jgi:hypothetical protein
MRRWIGGLFLLVSACGDPAVNASFEGNPLSTLDGVVCGGEVKTTPRLPLVGVLWKNDVQKISRPGADATPIENLSPIRFQLDMFTKPPEDMLGAYKANDHAVQAEIGFAILFDDVNSDGVYSKDADTLLGVAWDRVILYSAAGATSAGPGGDAAPYTFTNPEALKPGFQLASGVCDANGDPIAMPDSTSALQLLTARDSAHIYVLETPNQIPAEGPKGSCVRFF